MNTLFGVGALLFGAWVLPTVNPPADQPLQSPPAAPTEQGTAASPYALQNRSMNVLPDQGLPATGGLLPRQPFVPLPPTDPLLSGPDSPWAAPTENTSPTAMPGFGTRARAAGGVSPLALGGATSAYGGAAGRPNYRPYTEILAEQVRQNRLPSARAGGTSTKPFNTYTPPDPVSPYMNLYRTTTNGILNNYTTLVQPQVQQQQEAQMLANRIHRLQSATRAQSSVLQQQNQLLRGTTAPQYYMNYGDYYPTTTR